MKNMTFKKITSQRLFLPIFCLALVLLVNIVTTPNFFAIEVRNGVLYGYLIDIINRASELVILAVGMTLVVSSSAGTDISVGAIMAVSAAVCCNLLTGEISLFYLKIFFTFCLFALYSISLSCTLFLALRRRSSSSAA